jgi:hypothetical protein
VPVLPTLFLAAPNPYLWDSRAEHDPCFSISLDHSPWTAFVERYATQGQ